MEWSVLIETRATDEIDEDEILSMIGDLAVKLADYGAVGGGDGRGWDVRLSMSAGDAVEAIEMGRKVVLDAVEAVGLPAWPVVRAESVEESILDAELETPNFPDLVGTSEVSEMLHISRQRLHELRASGRFPEPMVTLSGIPIWLRGAVTAFDAQWERKVGRPADPVVTALRRLQRAERQRIDNPQTHPAEYNEARLGYAKALRDAGQPVPHGMDVPIGN